MTEKVLLWIFIATTIAMTLAACGWQILTGNKRWADKWAYLGHRVRTDYDASLSDQGKEEVRRAVTALYRASQGTTIQVPLFYIEVVPVGYVRTPSIPNGVNPVSGRLVAGSIRKEGKHWVAVVTEGFVGSLVVHEVAQHIAPAHNGEGQNPGHDNPEFAEYEHKAMKLYQRSGE